MKYYSEKNTLSISYQEWLSLGKAFDVISSRSSKLIKTASTTSSIESYSLNDLGNGIYCVSGRIGDRYTYGRYVIAGFTPYKISPDELKSRLRKFGFDIDSTKGGSEDSDWKATRANTAPITVSSTGWDKKNGYRVTFRNIRGSHGSEFAEALFTRRFDYDDLISKGFNINTLKYDDKDVVPLEEKPIEIKPEMVSLNMAASKMAKDFYSMLVDGKWYPIEEIDTVDNIVLLNAPSLDDNMKVLEDGALIPIYKTFSLPVELRA
jgi:hypothetical protein